MLNFNTTDPEKLDYVEPDMLRLSMYWYIAKDGTIVKAQDLLEAVQKARPGYYMLGNHSGHFVTDNYKPSGNIFHIGYGIKETIGKHAGISFISDEQFVRDFYDKFYDYLIIYPTSEKTYNKWMFHYKHCINYPYAFLAYEIKNNSAVISTDLCRCCNACSTN
ncbi:MAG: hypothetical protein LBL79_05995 [Prevotella sp.]|jgi:hypothetical protein|nr:hypothetical protein [Prevotella sp.]